MKYLITALFALTLSSGTIAYEIRTDLNKVPFPVPKSAAKVHAKWYINIGATISDIEADKQALYVAYNNNSLISFDYHDADVRRNWEFEADGDIRDLQLNHDILIAGSADGYLYALNKTNGESQWEYEAAGAVNGVFAKDGHVLIRVFSATKDSEWLVLVDAKSGQEIWRYVLAKTPDRVNDSHYQGDDRKTAKNINLLASHGIDQIGIHNDQVFFSTSNWMSDEATLNALNLKTGQHLWTKAGVGRFTFYENRVLTHSADSDRIYSLNTRTGKDLNITFHTRWGDIQHPWTLIDDSIFLLSEQCEAIRADLRSGATEWTSRICASRFLPYQNELLFLNEQGAYGMADAADGTEFWSISNIGGKLSNHSVNVDEHLFIIANKKSIFYFSPVKKG